MRLWVWILLGRFRGDQIVEADQIVNARSPLSVNYYISLVFPEMGHGPDGQDGIRHNNSRADHDGLRRAVEESELPNMDPDLLTIYVAVDELLELAVPTPSEGEIQGLPQMATTTHFSRLTFKHSNNPDWDYQPWFAGKIIATKDHVRRAVEAGISG